jgi:membrane protein
VPDCCALRSPRRTLAAAGAAVRAAALGVGRVVDPERDTPLGLGARAVRRYLDDGMTDRAPTIAYYGILSLFPSLLLAFSLVRLVGGADAPADIASYAQGHGTSGAVAGALRSAATTARQAPVPTAGAIGAASVVTLVYGASRALTATGRALDVIGRRPGHGRSLARRAQDIGWTLVLLLLGLVAIGLVTISGHVLEDFLGLFGVSGAAVDVWSIARWPVVAALALVVVAVMRWATPSTRPRRFRLVTPGVVATVGILVVETVGYDIYVTSIASYNVTYGAFAGLVILLLWIWLAGTAILLGAELDAVLADRAGPSQRPSQTSATSSTS